jgi:electron transfer flavoprotein alpha subunit
LPGQGIKVDDAFGPVWVIAEQIKGTILPVSFQLTGHARKLADELNVPLEVILLGETPSGGIERVIASGADRVYLGNASGLIPYQSEIYVEIITKLAREKQPEILLLGSTSMGRELAPLIAARLGTGLTAHCIDLKFNEEKVLEGIVPAYGVLLSIVCPEKRPQMATVAQGVFPHPGQEEGRTGEIVLLEIPEGMNQRMQTMEVVREEPEGVDLETASIIVAGGAGVVDVNGWRLIEDLAAVLNAALGSTRPAVDEGWTELKTMIGQSGKMVSPKFYIGVGLSGELQHMVGILGTPTTVAINNDPKAPVFEQVDYGIVEDCKEFVPLLIARLKEYRTKREKL